MGAFTATGAGSDQPVHGEFAAALQGERCRSAARKVWSGGVHEDSARPPRTKQRGRICEDGIEREMRADYSSKIYFYWYILRTN